MQTYDQRILNNSSCPAYRETLINSAGARIALSIYESGPTRPWVIFIPGTMTHPLFYDDFLTALCANGYSVIGIHLLSHGKSPRHRKIYTFDDMIQNVRDTITFCTENFSDNIILMGSSQGGMLSVAVAAEDHRVRAVFAHNAVLPVLKESITITRFPEFFKHFQKIIFAFMKFGAWAFPSLPVPITTYLELDRISRSPEVIKQYLSDPLGLTAYPLSFMASMFCAELPGVTDGSIQCPVVVIASTGDELFPQEYMRMVYEKIVAPEKKMLILEEPYHLLFNECVKKVMGPVVKELNAHS